MRSTPDAGGRWAVWSVVGLVVCVGLLAGTPGVRAPAPEPSASAAAAATLGWTQAGVNSFLVPPPRQQYGMAYDPLLKEVVLFGGDDQNDQPLGDTWVFASGNWTQVTSTVSPAARYADGLVYDPALRGLVLFGGASGYSTFFNDTWLFDAHGWHALAPLRSPTPRGSTGLVYDSTDGAVLLLAGPPHLPFQEFWEFNGTTWTNITSTAGPLPPTVWAGIVDDPAGHGVLFFGGSQGCYNPTGGLALTWTYSNGTWRNVTGAQSLTPVDSIGSLAVGYDPALAGVVMFSGYTLGCAAVSTTYLFTGGQWTNLTSVVGTPPPARWNARLVNVPGVGDLVFSGNEAPYGGSNEFGDDAWALGYGYPVTFSESGLTPGTVWSVTIGGFTRSSPTSTIVYLEENGTYPFEVGAPAGYVATPGSGSVTVRGAAASTAIAFIVLSTGSYLVAFFETGLPAGTGWSVTLNGSTQSGRGTFLIFEERNGTYPFTSGSVVGFTPGPPSGQVFVNGTPVAQLITYTSSVLVPTSATAGGGTDWVALVPWAVIVGGVALAFILVRWPPRRLLGFQRP